MPRYRRRKDPSLIEIVPSLGALLALGLFFSPAFRQLLGALFFLVLGLSILTVIGLIVWGIWKMTRGTPETEQFMPPMSGTPARPVPFAANGRVGLLEPPVQVYSPTWSQELLSQLEWKRFEDLVAAYSRELGYEAKTTRIGADGGVDVQLFQNGQLVMIIQCKAWDAYRVGVKPVRELFGVMAADKVANGAFFTTGEFSSEAEEWARDKNLDLVNGREFLNRIKQLTAEQQSSLLAIATAGDYTTPTCPSCGVKMVTRTASKGPSEGREFYGCRNYPGCRQTFRIPSA
jgi:restriction system protein